MALNAANASNTRSSEPYLGGQYAEILDFLCSPVTGLSNVKVLLSEPGLGKTVLLRSAIERIKGEARTAFVFWTLFKARDFVSHLLGEMGSSQPPPSDLNAAQGQFEDLLRRSAAEGKRFVLAIDEAHNLSPAALRNLSALLNRDTAHPPQVTVLLAGLPGLQYRLADAEASGIRERIAGVMTIAPLNAEQTSEYIGARITALGVGPVSQKELADIAARSGGVLRIIDNLCHQLLPQNGGSQQRTNDAPRVDAQMNETSVVPELHAARISSWARYRSALWSGTVAELAAAAGMSAEEVSDAIENRTEELRRAGIAVALQRFPGKPRMITLSPVEGEQTPESHEANPELPKDDANRQPKQEDPELEIEPGLHQEPASTTRVDLTNAVGESRSSNRRGARALKATLVLAAIMGGAGGLLYLSLSSPDSLHQAATVSERVSEPSRTPEGNKVTDLQSHAEAGDIRSQATVADQYHEGNGAPHDDKAAKASDEQAAVRGDSVAQHRLGLALSSGNGGAAVDRVAAYAWLVMSQNGGQTIDQATLNSLTRSLTSSEILDVRYRLGLMYEHGIGCIPDLVFADEWFLLGAAAGDARSRAASSALEQRMSPGQIAQAHARSDDWLRRHTLEAASSDAPR